MRGSRRAGWRERWARQENERRDAAYEASLSRWRRRDAELRGLLEAATTTEPARDGDWEAWFEPAPGETVYWTAGDAGLIEAPYVLRLSPPSHREFGRADEPAAGAPFDTGQVAVTDRRVVFAGRTRREWPYSKLIGMSHTVAGETWLLDTTRQKVSGLAPRPPAVSEFRLHLALALADRAGERDAFVAELAEQVDRHEQGKPEPPAPAAADEAPPSARWAGRVQPLAAVAASAALVLFVTIGIALAGNDQRPDSFSAPAEPPAVASSPPAVAPSTPAVAPRGEPVRRAVPPRQQPPPPPPPPTTPAPPTPSPSTDDTVDPWFPSCDEANEHGYGPYHRDQDPEYYWYPDRNGDGVVCRP